MPGKRRKSRKRIKNRKLRNKRRRMQRRGLQRKPQARRVKKPSRPRLQTTPADGAQHNEAAFQRGHAAGYAEGVYAGGEQIVERLMPADAILPDVTIEQIIAAGIPQFERSFVTLQPVRAVYERLRNALESQQGYSLVRLGDGELLTLSQEKVLPLEEVLKRGPFLPYAGVRIPDLSARDQVAQAVAKADIVGVPANRMPNFMLLLMPALQANGIDIRGLETTYSTVNYMLLQAGLFADLFARRRILAVGDRAGALAECLRATGLAVCEPVHPVHGMADVSSVLQQVATREFDLALVSAGIPAVIIAQRIAETYGKVAIDFGHAANSIIKGEVKLW